MCVCPCMVSNVDLNARSMVVGEPFKNFYSCRLSAGCGTENLLVRDAGALSCRTCVPACRHEHIQPRRSVAPSWCLAKKNGGKGNYSFAFQGKLKDLGQQEVHPVGRHARSSGGWSCGARFRSFPGGSLPIAWLGTVIPSGREAMFWCRNTLKQYATCAVKGRSLPAAAGLQFCWQRCCPAASWQE